MIDLAFNFDLCQFPKVDLGIELIAKRHSHKYAKMVLEQRTSTRPINQALQSIDLENFFLFIY